MSTVLEHTDISTPGVYDLPDRAYHADPVPERLGGSLSVSGARRLLPPSCPALFHYQREHPPTPSANFDWGHAAHKLVLGTGPVIDTIDADDWRSKAAREFRNDCHTAGVVPLLTKEYEQVEQMATAIKAHPVASRLFDPDTGQAEQSLFWQDDPDKPWRRGRLDWLPHATKGRMVIPDYKTSVTANPEAFGKHAATYGYHMQADWYQSAVKALGLAEVTAFVFVVQEKTAPFLVTVIELDAEALALGRAMNTRALDVYAECVSADSWPGYSDDVEQASLPYWYIRQNEETL